jgi:hypothetical protein
MNNIGVSTSAYASVAVPLSSVAKLAIGLETADAKEEVLAPIEESPNGSAAFDGQADGANPSSVNDSERQQEAQLAERKEQQQQQADQVQIRELAARDREVRAHEQAHAAVGGQYAGSPSYSFQRGPDGVNYAVGGEVAISLPGGVEDDPRGAIVAAQQVRSAALAPANPSSADRRIAAAATQIVLSAKMVIVQQQVEKQAELKQQRLEEQKEQQPVESEPQQAQNVENSNSPRGQQLASFDQVQREPNLGSVLDQLA